MANWAPSLVLPSANYITLLDTLQARDIDAATMAETPTNPPTGYLRFSRGGLFFEEWSGSAWVSRTLSVAGGGTGATTGAGARSGLGLGTIATQNNNAINITGGTITGITALQVSGIASADQYVGSSFSLSGPSPALFFTENDQASNAQKWNIQVDGQIMQVVVQNDDGSTQKIPFYITRAGDARFSDTLYVNALSAAQAVYSDFLRRLDGTNSIINAGFGINAHWANQHEFKNLAGNISVLKIMHNSQLTSSVSGTAVLSGGFGSPNTGKLIIGDGTGWNYAVAKRQTGGTTDLFLFADNGDFRADKIKSLNSFALDLGAFNEGGINFKLTDVVNATITNSSTLSVNTIKNLSGTALTFNASSQISFQISGTNSFSIANLSFGLVGFYNNCIGLGGYSNTWYPGGTVLNDFDISNKAAAYMGSDGIVDITGLAGVFTGRLLFFYSYGGSIRFNHDHTASAPNNRMWLPNAAPLVLNTFQGIVFFWSDVLSKWIIVGRSQ